MSRDPGGPFIELNFYYPHLKEREAFALLFNTLLDLGVEFTGKGAVHIGPGINGQPFETPTDLLMVDIDFDAKDIERVLAEPDMRLVQAYLQGTVDLPEQPVLDILTYEMISETASKTDVHPLAIWMEGVVFDPIPEYEPLAPVVGLALYERFTEIVRRTGPVYAAITWEWGLECIADLKLDPRSLAFRDFYVSETFVGKENLRKLEQLYPGAYVEEVGDGLYISCWSDVNPDRKSLKLTDQDADVVKMLTSV